MKTSTFHWNSILWLRERAGLQTETVPASPIEDVRAPLLVPGFFSRSSFPRRCAFIGLWVSAVALVFAMTGTPALSLETRHAFQELGQAGLLIGAVLELVAFMASRLTRKRALVELRPAAAGPATVASLRALHEQARGAVVWVVGEQQPEPMALATAASLGIRCLGTDDDGTTWREHAARPNASGSSSRHELAAPAPYALSTK